MNQIQQLANYIIKLKILDGLKFSNKYKYQDLVSVIVDVIYSYDEDNERDTQNTIKNFRNHFNVSKEFTVSEFLNEVAKMNYEEVATNIFKTKLMTKAKGGILRAQAVIEWAKIFKKNKIETLDDVITIYSSPIVEKQLLQVNGQEDGKALHRLLQIAGDDMFVKVARYQVDFINDALDEIIDGVEAIRLLKAATIALNDRFVGIQLIDLDYAIWEYMQQPNAKRFPNEIRNMHRPPKKGKIINH